MQWVPVIALCVTLLLTFMAALRTSMTVGGVVAELRKSIEDMRAWRDSVALIPTMHRDIQELKERVDKLHSLVPPMRERLDSVNEEVDEIKSKDLPERTAKLEAKLSGEHHAAHAPIPRYDPPYGRRK